MQRASKQFTDYHLQVPAAFLTVMLPHYYAILASKGTYDNANPRGHQEHILNNEALDKAVRLSLTSPFPIPHLSHWK